MELLYDEKVLDLRDAIIERAVDDYVKSLRLNREKRKKECERFFRSGWFNTLSFSQIDGLTVIAKLKDLSKDPDFHKTVGRKPKKEGDEGIDKY